MPYKVKNIELDKNQHLILRNMRWGFNILALFFILFLAVYSWLAWQGVKKDQSDSLSSIAELSGNALDSYFSHYEYSCKVFAQDLRDERGALRRGQSHALLKRFLQANPDLLTTNLIRPDGQIIASTEEYSGKPFPSQANATSFIIARDGFKNGANFNIGRPFFGQLVNEWVIPLRYALRDKNGELLYIVAGALPLSRQQSFWRDLSLPENTALGLIRDDAYLLSRYPDAGKIEYEELYGKPRSGILVEHLKRLEYPPRGNVEGYNSAAQKDFLFSYRRLTHYPVTLFVATPISNVHTRWWRQVRVTYLLSLLFVLGGYIVYHQASRRQLSWETERLLHEEEMRSIYDVLLESEERFRRVASEAPFPMMIHAEDGEVLEINKAWSEATGYSHADIPSIPIWLQHAYPDKVHIMQKIVEKMYGIAHRVDQGERVIRCKDGSLRTWHFSASPVGRLPDGRRYIVSMAQDVSERKAAQQQIEFLAYHDALTGLPNRLLAKDHLEQAILAAERAYSRVALLFIDLDKFKTINDSLGHVIGDGLLKAASIRLRECLRDTDTLSRQGGDEFLIVLSNMPDTESITVVTEKILARMAEPFAIDQHELAISLSIGIAVYPDDGKDFDTLLKQSDTAMYQAKDSGRNTYRFHTEQMNIDAIEHLRMRNGLRRAVEQGEFVLHYQAQINLATGAVMGAEALIRWNHPELGMVLPDRFISIAEDSGLIVPIGDWVMSEACRQAVAWRSAGLPELFIAVNLSALQFKRDEVEKSVTRALAESGFNPALLELELTESILIRDTEKVLAAVQRLKKLGVKFSIDDFGTGYSSLSYLKRFNVDKLKIDQSFVRDMADDPNDAAIVGAIIQMAKSLGLTTIAEGVEDERQLSQLRLLHCDDAQGYYFAKPMPAAEFANFIANPR